MTNSLDTIVIGGGQAGLSTGYYLKKAGRSFVILDDQQRTGDVWRKRWDSLRLFTPAAFSSLDGMPFPSRRDHFPTKDEFADYLEAYVRRFHLPVRHGARVERLSRDGAGFVASTSAGDFRSDNVIVAMSNYQRPKIPGFAQELRPDIVQLHSSEYRHPSQLPEDGPVLVVGSGNSGAEIALELSRRQEVMLAGRYPGHLPFSINSRAAHAVLIRFALKVVFHRVLSVATPIGRRARPKFLKGSGILIRTKAKHLEAAGVKRLPRVEGVRDGLPLLADGRTLDVKAVVWCTGFRPGFEWIDLPLTFDEKGPVHERGVVPEVPGLYFVGLHYLYAFSSAMIHGVGRDAKRIVATIGRQAAAPESRTDTAASPVPA
ncbi:MAG TPA: NAD(P)-binding domain-containing protein [Trueperaceae bacterium]